MKTDTKKVEKTPMRMAVDYLRYIGKIESDSDLAAKLGLTKGTVSTYITGEPSNDFRRRFEEMFEIKLDDFSNIVSRENGLPPDQMTLYDRILITVLKEYVAKLMVECKTKFPNDLEKCLGEIDDSTTLELNKLKQRLYLKSAK